MPNSRWSRPSPGAHVQIPHTETVKVLSYLFQPQMVSQAEFMLIGLYTIVGKNAQLHFSRLAAHCQSTQT